MSNVAYIDFFKVSDYRGLVDLMVRVDYRTTVKERTGSLTKDTIESILTDNMESFIDELLEQGKYDWVQVVGLLSKDETGDALKGWFISYMSKRLYQLGLHDEFTTYVEDLAAYLKITREPEHIITYYAISQEYYADSLYALKLHRPILVTSRRSEAVIYCNVLKAQFPEYKTIRVESHLLAHQVLIGRYTEVSDEDRDVMIRMGVDLKYVLDIHNRYLTEDEITKLGEDLMEGYDKAKLKGHTMLTYLKRRRFKLNALTTLRYAIHIPIYYSIFRLAVALWSVLG